MSENTQYAVDAPEGAPTGANQYLTKKDAKLIIAITVVILVCLYPAYALALDYRNKKLCSDNMADIMTAIDLYAEQHDDRYPPMFRESAPGQPALNESGHPWTWASDIAEGRSTRTDFLCPATTEKEVAMLESPTDPAKPIKASYGMYLAYGGLLRTSVENPDETILVAETSNHGAESSFDPKPLGAIDGYLIGWSNSNSAPDEDTIAVTRLAIRGTAKGDFSEEGSQTRHRDGIHAMTASKRRLTIKGPFALTQWNAAQSSLRGTWATPLLLKKRD